MAGATEEWAAGTWAAKAVERGKEEAREGEGKAKGGMGEAEAGAKGVGGPPVQAFGDHYESP